MQSSKLSKIFPKNITQDYIYLLSRFNDQITCNSKDVLYTQTCALPPVLILIMRSQLLMLTGCQKLDISRTECQFSLK